MSNLVHSSCQGNPGMIIDRHDIKLAEFRVQNTYFKAFTQSVELPMTTKSQEIFLQFISFFQKVPFEPTLSSSTKKNLYKWLKEFVICSQLFKKFLPSLEPKYGRSKGLLYRITKEDKDDIRGFLFATFHSIELKESYTITESCKCSWYVQKCLLYSDILVTEVKVEKTTAKYICSVQENLANLAWDKGIINLGIDREEKPIKQEMETEVDHRRRILDHIEANEYCHGKIDALRQEIDNQPSEISTYNLERKSVMVRNIDTLLRTMEEVAREISTTITPKIFIALDVRRFISTKQQEVPNTVKAMLSQRGWTIEFIDQNWYYSQLMDIVNNPPSYFSEEYYQNPIKSFKSDR